MSSLLDKCPKSLKSAIPLRRDLLQITLRLLNPMLIHLPKPLAAMPPAAHETYLLHDMQMLSNSLASDVRAGGEPSNRHGPIHAKPQDKAQPLFVT